MIDKKYYINVREKMTEKNIDLPKPELKIIWITVPLWSDLNVH